MQPVTPASQTRVQKAMAELNEALKEMQSSTPPSKSGLNWSIVIPNSNGVTLYLNSDGTVTIKVDDNGDGNPGYRAGIYDANGTPTPYDDCTPMAGPDGSGCYTENIEPGLGTDKKVIVYVEGAPGNYKTRQFYDQAGSGSGSGSGGMGGAVMVRSLGVSVPTTLYAHISANGLKGVFPLRHDHTAAVWTSDEVCGRGGFRLASHGTKWLLTVQGPVTHRASVARAGPSHPFQVVFRKVALPVGGGGVVQAEVEILVG